jgi:hypothetical protein
VLIFILLVLEIKPVMFAMGVLFKWWLH